jgi:hypothetical protein
MLLIALLTLSTDKAVICGRAWRLDICSVSSPCILNKADILSYYPCIPKNAHTEEDR